MRSSVEVRAAAVIAAGGAGRRMGATERKQFLLIAGRPVLRHALQPFLDHPAITSVVAVVPPPTAADPPDWLSALPLTIVAGGAERADSVWNGLRATPEDAELVLIHDGARPFVSAALLDRVLAAAASGAAVPALPVTETLKEVDAQGYVLATPDRGRFWVAQTPQGFTRRLIMEAYARAHEEGVYGTDDASLAERFGARVAVVEGSAENVKITRQTDLRLAEALAPYFHPG